MHDRVTGLRSGADDYLVKPFALEELVARLEALLRRPGQLLGRSLQVANLAFDTESRQAFIDDKPQVLSARETAVLELLMRRKDRVVSKKLVEDHIFGLSGEVASNAVEVYVHRLRKQLSERGAKVQIHTIRGVGYLISEEKAGVISFKSIFSRIIFLHVIAMVITAIFMPLVLYWFVRSAANDLHDQAMREQADLVAHHLVLQADGGWTLDLPPPLQALYSQAYGRYAYAVIDDGGRVLFSSLKDRSPMFARDPRSPDIAFLTTRRGQRRHVGGQPARRRSPAAGSGFRSARTLAHRDVIIDDVVAEFFKRVGWITLPILLFLLAIDIVIFRRALRPLLNASEMAKQINPKRTDVRLSAEEHSEGDPAAGAGGEPGARSSRGRVPRAARVHGRCRA